MRSRISEVYPGMNWRHKVHYMSDNQVTAVYLSFLKEGKLDPSFDPSKKKQAKEKDIPKEEKHQQLTIFDFLGE